MGISTETDARPTRVCARQPIANYDAETTRTVRSQHHGGVAVGLLAQFNYLGEEAGTATFAVESIRRWWHSMGQARFPDATRLVITADAGGSNGHHVKLPKVELSNLAEETGLPITVCRYPPVSSRTIIELISATTTKSGLKIKAERDWNYTLTTAPNA